MKAKSQVGQNRRGQITSDGCCGPASDGGHFSPLKRSRIIHPKKIHIKRSLGRTWIFLRVFFQPEKRVGRVVTFASSGLKDKCHGGEERGPVKMGGLTSKSVPGNSANVACLGW